MREFNHYTPVVSYAGAARESDRTAAAAAEADAFVAKPDVDELMGTVKYFLA